MSATKEPQKRNCLTLKKKVEVIHFHQENPTISVRALGEKFECGKTQIAYILKRKAEILSLFRNSASVSRHIITGKSRTSEYGDVNEALYRWFCIARSKNISPGGPELTEKAKEIAIKLGKPGFKGSRGWLDKWKKRFNVNELKICGEAGDVETATAESWKEHLPEIVQGYEKDDIWNMDETGFFWRALPDKDFSLQSTQCKRGEKAKQRLTVAFFVTATGKKEKPVVICESDTPKCLRQFDESLLPVTYFTQAKAWMTGEILESVLTKLNAHLISNDRRILLFMDNKPCYPRKLCTKFSNIQICFLPPSTSSILQPLDLGIIRNFKTHYRQLFLRNVISKIDEYDKASDVVKCVDLSTAIRWIAQAWSRVTADTISKCFRKAGIPDAADLDASFRDVGDEEPALEADDLLELGELIQKTVDDGCSSNEFVSGDDDLPVCLEMDDDNWQSLFLDDLANNPEKEDGKEDAADEIEDGSAVSEFLPGIQSYKEAIVTLEEVALFLQERGHFEEAMRLGTIIDAVCKCKTASTSTSAGHTGQLV